MSKKDWCTSVALMHEGYTFLVYIKYKTKE